MVERGNEGEPRRGRAATGSRASDRDALVTPRRRRKRRGNGGHRVRNALIALAAVLVAVVAATGVTAEVMLSDCSLASLRPISLGANSFLFAKDGSLLGVIPSTTNRQPLELRKISPWLAKATVAIEDRRFYRHGGIDYQGIARAAFKDLMAGRIVEGGSTITQELVRNLYIGSSQRTLHRKVREACLANKLAAKWTKNQILSAYLNEVFYGRHAFGAEAGAETYFSTSARRLTLGQAALLAGLPQAPSTYDPLRHQDVARARRDEVLRAMLAQGYITQQDYASAVVRPLGLRPGRLYSEIRHPNFFGFAEQQLVAQYGARRVAAGGLRVRTTVDASLQLAARRIIADHLREPTDPAAALVAIDPSTGAIKTMIAYVPGGKQLQFNLASQGHRTAGSAFKPFVLATAINQGISVYSSFYGPPQFTITDPLCSTNGTLWDVHNYADEAAGTMNLLDATANSVNTIFAQLVDKVGPANVIPVAHRMGITSPLQAVCSITLGTQAVTPLEMTDAYATLAARGVHHPAQAIAVVRDPNGKVVGHLDTQGERALPQNTADLVTYALEGVVQHGTGTAAGFGRPAAGKTGTAENFQDAWFCGYVPQLAACVWVGYPHSEVPMYGIEGFGSVFGGSLPAEIWHDFMSLATAKLPVKDFVYPASFGGSYVSGSSGYTTQPSLTPTTPSTTTTPAKPQAPAPSTTPTPVPTPTTPPPEPVPPPTETTPPPEPPPTPTGTTPG